MSTNGQSEQRGNNDDFLSLGASVGDALQLQDMTHAKHRYYTKLIGYLNKHSIVVTHPQFDGELIAAHDGEEFQVRGFAGRVTYEFSAKVLSVSEQPFPHMHLSFPESVFTLEMRGAMRIKTKLSCSVVASVGGLKMPATIADLSTSGASVLSSIDLGKKGDAIQLHSRFAVDGEEHPFVMSAIIRNVGEPNEEQVVTYGVEFVGTTNRARIALQTYVYSILIAKQSD